MVQQQPPVPLSLKNSPQNALPLIKFGKTFKRKVMSNASMEMYKCAKRLNVKLDEFEHVKKTAIHE